MKVVVTGASGYFGTILIPALLRDPRVAAVVGVDLQAPPAGAAWATHPAYRHERLDLAVASADDWRPVLAGADAVVHLAFRVAHHPGEETAATNTRGQRVFLEVAAEAPRQLVVASAIAVYGFAPGRDPVAGTLDETAPLTGNTRVAYAEHKQQLERYLDELEARSPATIVRARPTNVAGPGMPLKRAPLLTNPVMMVPMVSHAIRQQLLHEEDLASAFLRLLDAPAGAYNVAPDDWVTLDDAAKVTGQGVMRFPPFILRGMADMAWRMGQSAFDGSWLAFFEHPPIIVSNAKLRGLGWTPTRTTADVLREIAPIARGGKARSGPLGAGV